MGSIEMLESSAPDIKNDFFIEVILGHSLAFIGTTPGIQTEFWQVNKGESAKRIVPYILLANNKKNRLIDFLLGV